MDGMKMRFLNVILLTLSVMVLFHPANATFQNRIADEENKRQFQEYIQEALKKSATSSRPSVFPNHLDISSLQNMPMVILHPRTPINFQLLPGDNLEFIQKALNPSKILELLQSASFSSSSNLSPQNSNTEESREPGNKYDGSRQPQDTGNHETSEQSDSKLNDQVLPRSPISFELLPGDNLSSIHKTLNPSKILELLQSATISSSSNLSPQNSNTEESRESRNRYSGNRQPQATMNHETSVQPDSQFNDLALPRSFMNPNMHSGWLQRFRGSFSNMLPRFRPMNGGPFPLSLPTANLPTFLPQPSNMHGIVSPFTPSSFQQFQSLPWRKFNFPSLSTGYHGDLNTGASHLSPLRAMFSNLPMIGFKPPGYGHPAFGGDLATSGSSFIPRHILPPPPSFALPKPSVQRHKPLFNNVGGLHAASMEISNAFADFTDSKEHGPEVTQKFGSVGHSINNFLKMMGLGSDLSFGNVGGFGGGADMAALDSTPIARSLDFYPGYGNQAHLDEFENLDDMGDFPMFEKDITQEFMKKMNLTNETIKDEMKKEKDVIVKEVTVNKSKLGAMEKDKLPMIKVMKHKDHDDKSKKNEAADTPYAPAVPLQKMKDEKLSEKIEHPVVNYKIPPIHATVAPNDRKLPIAIYQNFNPQNRNAPKPSTYAPAEAMPHREEEENPNKLIDEDVVRQWRLVNSGKGYVEKHPVPLVDNIQTSKEPESLKVLQKVITDTVKKNSS